MNEHLHSVPESNGSGGEAKNTRAKSRPRATKALPTDRLKFEVQVAALKAIAIASNNGKQPVSAEEIAPALGVVSTTAGLNNAFFMESGLITRERKGHYKPTDAVREFARRHSFNPKEAGEELAETLGGTWYFASTRQRLEMGEATREQVISVLAHAAGVMAERSNQLSSLLAWLEYAGLITTAGGRVRLAAATAETPEETTQPVTLSAEPKVDPAEGAGQGTTGNASRQDPAPKSEALLSLSFDFALTASDLQQLSAEQIQALYKAVGEVMAIKATIQDVEQN
jgi:hypothetical protein